MAGQSRIGIERPQQFEAFCRAVHHGGRNRVIQYHQGTGRDAFQQFVQCKDLGPIRLLSSCRLVMDCGNCRLQLIETYRSLRE